MAMKVGTPLPSFEGEVEWLRNVRPDLSEGARLVFVHFWAMSCPACKANMPDVQSLRDQHLDIRCIAIHAPRSPEDTDVEKVRQMADEIGITEPCAIDNRHVLSDRFDLSGLWPYYFLFDAEGKMKRRGAGGMSLNILKVVLAELGSVHSRTTGEG